MKRPHYFDFISYIDSHDRQGHFIVSEMSCLGSMSPFFKNKDMITTAEDVIIISSDEDCDDEELEEASIKNNSSFMRHSCAYNPFKATLTTSPIVIEDSDEEELSDLLASHKNEGNQVKENERNYPTSNFKDEEDLPDLCLGNDCEGKQLKENEQNYPISHFSDEEELPDLCIHLEKKGKQVKENEDKQVKENARNSFLKRIKETAESEPPMKVLKIDDKLISQSDCPFGLQVVLLKKRISNSILRGGFKGQSFNPCNTSFTSCYEIHKNQPKSNRTPAQSKVLFETMFDDEKLQVFALRAMSHSTVSYKQYLDPSLLNLLLQYLFGSEEKQELPDAQGLHLGISILYKLLNFHPPCKEGMHNIYLKMCQDWFILLLQRVKTVLNDEPCVSEVVSTQENIHQGQSESEDTFSDYTSVIRKKAIEKREKYLQRTKTEKLHHLSVLTKYFSKVMECSFFQWSIRHWQRKSSALFRRDVCPILSEILWGSSNWSTDWGSVNQLVQDLFGLYCKSTKEHSLHESFGSLIAICAAILHRKEMAVYPEMGQMTRTYAHKLYMEIKSSSDVEVNLRNVHPDWLKFHIASLFLGVEEPANFFKTKERISKVLHDKDEHKDRDFYHSTFCMDTVCFEAIKSMMGMMQIKSSVPEECDLVDRILEDNNSWFEDILKDENISHQLKMIKLTLGLPYIKSRKWYFDGFENFYDT